MRSNPTPHGMRGVATRFAFVVLGMGTVAVAGCGGDAQPPPPNLDGSVDSGFRDAGTFDGATDDNGMPPDDGGAVVVLDQARLPYAIAWLELVDLGGQIVGGPDRRDRGLEPLHHGGGVGMGYSQHSGMVIVADGTDAAAKRLARVLVNDCGSGVMRHADAGYELAVKTAREQGLKELGYHFVIGNGNGMADGELFVGRRWRDQVPGAHVGGKDGDWYNQRSIGLCIVGDGDKGRLTEAQEERLAELTASLCRRLGISPSRVYLHSDLAPTTSPGKLFPAASFRADVAGRL